MKKIFLLLSAVLLSVSVFAAADGGVTALNFLHLDAGARYLGMGGVGVAGADDIMGVMYNPAAIGKLNTVHVGGSTGKQGWDFKSNFIGLSIPLRGLSFTRKDPLVIGVSGFFSDNGSDDVYGGYISGPGGVIERDFGDDMAINLTLSEKVAESDFLRGSLMHHYAGITGKYLRSSLPDPYSMEDITSDAWALDLGYQGYVPDYRTGIGVSLNNLGTKIKYIDVEDPLPMNLRAGIIFNVATTKAFTLGLGADYIRYIKEKDDRVHLGLEMRLFEILAARAGYRLLEEDDDNITIGFGLSLFGLKVDYGFMLDPLFGGTLNQISVSFTFPGGKKDDVNEVGKTPTRRSADYVRPQPQPVRPRTTPNRNPIIY